MVLERDVWYQILVVRQSRRWVSDQLLLVFCAGRDLLRSFEKSVGKIRLEGYPAGRGADPARGGPGGG
ncbi:hypothetical protein F511_29753 [Dorcoceras hygrometricum]|uniref:Uncharacterized protein n=1 Tax=Dorcoceras hygrometricum TaxID=472368 RepID=A0A2Z7BXM8_9LAMI|nr:hypothetical protein F511_29753 [Dorcoceras hygrometricum]